MVDLLITKNVSVNTMEVVARDACECHRSSSRSQAELACWCAGLAMLPAQVCNGVVVLFGPAFVYIIKSKYHGHAGDICFIMQASAALRMHPCIAASSKLC